MDHWTFVTVHKKVNSLVYLKVTFLSRLDSSFFLIIFGCFNTFRTIFKSPFILNAARVEVIEKMSYWKICNKVLVSQRLGTPFSMLNEHNAIGKHLVLSSFIWVVSSNQSWSLTRDHWLVTEGLWCVKQEPKIPSLSGAQLKEPTAP